MSRHPLEESLNASAWDILSAIQRGFRAQVDVKGKLAEYFLHRELTGLAKGGVVSRVEWRDKDREPDFLIEVGGRTLRLECKNARSRELFRNPDAYKVELQKTRNSKDGTPTRGYRIDEFELLAVCLFNQTRQWQFLSIATRHLARRPNLPEFLVVMQRVPLGPEGFWRSTIQEAIRDALAQEP